MRHDRGVVDLIERASDANQFCHCGAHTTPVERDGIVWLDCATLVDRPEGAVRRFLNGLIPHVHREIVDLRGEDLPAAA
jgi:hypothetical protein